MWQHESEVRRIVPRTPTIKSFQFARQPDMDYLPGQFLYVTVLVGSQAAIHHFSFTSSPTDRDYIEFTKVMTASDFSRALDGLKPGSRAVLKGPEGNFTLPPLPAKLGFLTGGIGIAPLYSIIRYLTHKDLPYDVVLLYANTNPDEIPFREELDAMASENRYLRVEHILSGPLVPPDWKGKRGVLNRTLIAELIPDYEEREFYISGSPNLVMNLKEQIDALGVPEDQLRLDTFLGYYD